MLFITEILCHCQSCLRHAHTGSWRLIHLAEHQGRLLQYSGFLHLGPEVISLTGTLSYSGKDGVSAVLCGDVSDQLLDQHGLSYTRASEQTDLTALCIRRQKVDDLDSGLKYLHDRALILE